MRFLKRRRDVHAVPVQPRAHRLAAMGPKLRARQSCRPRKRLSSSPSASIRKASRPSPADAARGRSSDRTHDGRIKQGSRTESLELVRARSSATALIS